MEIDKGLELIKSILEKEQINYLIYSRETEIEKLTTLKEEMQSHRFKHGWQIKLSLEKSLVFYDLVFSPALDEEEIRNQIEQILLNFSCISPGTVPGHSMFKPLDKSYRDLNFQIYDSNPTFYSLEDKLSLLFKLEKNIISQFRSIKETKAIVFKGIVENHVFMAPEIFKQYSVSNYTVEAEFTTIAGSVEIPFAVSQTRHNLTQAFDTNAMSNQIQLSITNFSNQSIIYGKETNVLITQQALVRILNFIAQSLVYSRNQPVPIFSDPHIQYFDSLMNLKDDATQTGGLMTRPFDVEGVNCGSFPLITNGYITQYLYDQFSAEKMQTNATGHAWYDDNWNFKLIPSNLIMAKGKYKMEDLLARLDPGVYLTEITDIFLDNHDNLHILGRGQSYKQGKNMNGIRGLYLKNLWSVFFRKMNMIGNEMIILDNVTGYPILMESIYATSNQA